MFTPMRDQRDDEVHNAITIRDEKAPVAGKEQERGVLKVIGRSEAIKARNQLDMRSLTELR